jgi:hypothetical protein
VRFVRPALRAVVKNDKGFVDVILLYLDRCLLTVSAVITKAFIHLAIRSSSRFISYLHS